MHGCREAERGRDRGLRWSVRRLAFAALLIGGQIATTYLARSGYALLPVTLPWLTSLAAAVALVLPTPACGWRPRLAWRSPDTLALVGLTLLAGALRLPNLESLPSGIHGDEGEFGVLARDVVQGVGPAPFGLAFLGDPALYVHLLAPFVSLLGPTMEAIRLPSALVGTATIPVLYGLVRELYGRRPALLAGFLLATSAVHIHFSRLALNVIEVPFFASLSLLFLARGLTRQRDHWYLLAGLAGGFGIYFHFGARLIPFILLLVLLGRRMAASGGWGVWLRQIALVGLGGFLALSPMLAYLSNDPATFNAHVQERGIWKHWEQLASRYDTLPSDKLGIIWGQTRRSIEAFTSLPDPSEGAGFYTFMDAPLLNGIEAPLALLGLLWLCLYLWQQRSRLLLIWFVVPLVLASILTDVAGQSHRLVHPLLPALVAAALLIDWLCRLAESRLPERLAAIAVPLLLVVPIAGGLWQGQQYFEPDVTMRLTPAHTAQARCLEALPPGTVALVAGAPWISEDHGPSRYLGAAVDRRDLPEPRTQLPVYTGGRTLVILVHTWNNDVLPFMRDLYPAAQSIEIQRPPGQTVLTVLAVPAEGESAATLLSRCGTNGGNRIARVR